MRLLTLSCEVIFSVVVPTFERAEAIPKAIETVRSQSFRQCEVLIVDDNHPDGEAHRETEKVIQPYLSEFVRYIKLEKNSGACVARNVGVQHAKGRYIAFLDDDDEWHPEKLQAHYDAFEQDSELAMSICNILEFFRGRETRYAFEPGDDFFGYFLNLGSGVSCSAIAVRKSAFDSANGFDPLQPSFQDLDLMLRMSRTGKAQVIPKFLTFYHLSDTGITYNPVKKLAGAQRILEKFEDSLSVPQYRVGRANLLSKCGDYAMLTEDSRFAMKQYWKSITLYDFSAKNLIKFLLACFGATEIFKSILNAKNK